MSVKILGTGSFLPEKSVSNDDLSKVMDTSDEWISSRTGIRSRHISIEDTTSTMAVKAAKKALENAGVSAEELDHILLQRYQEIMRHQVHPVRCRRESERSMQCAWISMRHVQDLCMD